MDQPANRTTKTAATVLGIFAGGAAIEHGIFEILRGPARPAGLMIASMGPPCDPDVVWNACEPAMTLIPNYRLTGIFATLIGLLTLVWVIGFLGRRGGGAVLIGLSVLSLLFGGGIFPPLIGTVGGLLALWIRRPYHRPAGRRGRWVASLWPWPLVVWGSWLLLQWVVGAIANDLMRDYGLIPGMVLILGGMALSVWSAVARDRGA